MALFRMKNCACEVAKIESCLKLNHVHLTGFLSGSFTSGRLLLNMKTLGGQNAKLIAQKMKLQRVCERSVEKTKFYFQFKWRLER